jgi:hypothetical protein
MANPTPKPNPKAGPNPFNMTPAQKAAYLARNQKPVTPPRKTGGVRVPNTGDMNGTQYDAYLKQVLKGMKK